MEKVKNIKTGKIAELVKVMKDEKYCVVRLESGNISRWIAENCLRLYQGRLYQGSHSKPSGDFEFTVATFGPSLVEQLEGVLDVDSSSVFEMDSKAMTRLYIRGYLSESEMCRARKKLSNKIKLAIVSEWEHTGFHFNHKESEYGDI